MKRDEKIRDEEKRDEEKKKRRIILIVIILLLILLFISLLALVGVIVYDRNHSPTEHDLAVVVVPDNLITPEADPTKPNPTKSPEPTNSPVIIIPPEKAATIKLYNKQPEDNATFNVGNMFPGDSETNYFRIQVSYKGEITVHYKATVRRGYEKLAEVLKVKVKLLTADEIMYDGLMKDMPDSVTYKLESAISATDELYYEITAYLDTSVGNEYQNKDLIADFSWWVEEKGNLTR